MPPQQPSQPQSPFSYQPTRFPTSPQPQPQQHSPYKRSRLTRLGVIVISAVVTVIAIIVVALSSGGGSQQNAVNDHARTDINNLRVSLQSYYAEGNADYASYPTLAQLNDASWRSENMTGVNELTLSPEGSTSGLVSGEPTDTAYSYSPTPTGCTNTANNPCTSYRLASKQVSGKLYVQKSEN